MLLLGPYNALFYYKLVFIKSASLASTSGCCSARAPRPLGSQGSRGSSSDKRGAKRQRRDSLELRGLSSSLAPAPVPSLCQWHATALRRPCPAKQAPQPWLAAGSACVDESRQSREQATCLLLCMHASLQKALCGAQALTGRLLAARQAATMRSSCLRERRPSLKAPKGSRFAALASLLTARLHMHARGAGSGVAQPACWPLASEPPRRAAARGPLALAAGQHALSAHQKLHPS